MSAARGRRYDVAVVGGGPVGALTAVAHARQGARVLLVEASPKAAGRLAGEWLHPPAIDALAAVGIDLVAERASYRTGEGFVVHPEDGSEPMLLPYEPGRRGVALEHAALVARLREVAGAHSDITYRPSTRAVSVGEGFIEIKGPTRSTTERIDAERVVGADGRASIVRQALALPVDPITCSRMAGILLTGARLPFEGFGHVILGGPGPVLGYRIGDDAIRLCLDVPLSHGRPGKALAFLWEAYAHALPPELRGAFEAALLAGRVQWAANQVRSRMHYGRGGLALVGDAVGHYHPFTAAGLYLGFGDALALAQARSTRAYQRARARATLVPEMLAVGLYEVFADDAPEVLAIRSAVYDMWRRHARERRRTMRFLAGDDRRLATFGAAFAGAVGSACAGLAADAVRRRQIAHTATTLRGLGERLAWFLRGALHLAPPTDTSRNRALRASAPRGEVVELDLGAEHQSADPNLALHRGTEQLLAAQRDDGSWEGEVVWCAMLAAQYALACHVTGRELSATRRRRLLRQLEATRDERGLWGLHAHSEPYLFTTTLAYVAARSLGVGAGDPFLGPARAFIAESGGVEAIPSWGKFWLAMLNLYSWRGVQPILPELWALPRWLPFHPASYYCHTRLIYMAMAAIYGRRFQRPADALTLALRDELFPGGFETVRWDAAQSRLRPGDLYRPPHPALRLIARGLPALERWTPRAERARILDELGARIRWELQTTDHTSISPVSGLLNLIALWLEDPADADLARGWERFEGWIFEDDQDGLRVAGARSGSWDTAFALQALAVIGGLDGESVGAASGASDIAAARGKGRSGRPELSTALRRGAQWLATQQIRAPFPGFAANDRQDPSGGFCFAGVWHGWPVSDCTAEAMEALVVAAEGAGLAADPAALEQAARFVLERQNRDGGFGTYERRRSVVPLEWLNPAEMFGDSMEEGSYVECTASAMAALVAVRDRMPAHLREPIARALTQGAAFLRRAQNPDGSWSGAWGVHFTYGTMFGVRGLRAAGAPVTDPAIRRACDWLLRHQRRDGGWGEHHESATVDRYVPHEHGQVVQTAWALSTLLDAQDPNWPALDAAALFLAAAQEDDGTWPRQDMSGVFFRTALLDYTLYRSIFPVWALGLYERRRAARESFTTSLAEAREAV